MTFHETTLKIKWFTKAYQFGQNMTHINVESLILASTPIKITCMNCFKLYTHEQQKKLLVRIEVQLNL